jgi:hypothetical protein
MLLGDVMYWLADKAARADQLIPFVRCRHEALPIKYR